MSRDLDSEILSLWIRCIRLARILQRGCGGRLQPVSKGLRAPVSNPSWEGFACLSCLIMMIGTTMAQNCFPMVCRGISRVFSSLQVCCRVFHELLLPLVPTITAKHSCRLCFPFRMPPRSMRSSRVCLDLFILKGNQRCVLFYSSNQKPDSSSYDSMVCV